DEIQQLIALVGSNGVPCSETVHPGNLNGAKPSRKRNGKQSLAIAALMENCSVTRAAAAASVSERTLHAWLARPDFQEALHRARQESVHSSLNRLIPMSQRAVDVLESRLNCGQPAVEVQAAGEILRLLHCCP